MRTPLAACLFVLASALATPALGQNEPGTIELTPYGSYSFGGTFKDEDTDTQAELQDSGSFGLIFDYKQRNNTQIEIIYSRQQTDAVVTDTMIPDVTMQYLQVGGTYLFEQDRLLPFMSATLGGTHIDADSGGYGSDTFFSFSIGGGLQFAPNSRVGLRLEARAFGTFLRSGSTVFCGSGPEGGVCSFTLEGDILWQVQTMAGIVFRF